MRVPVERTEVCPDDDAGRGRRGFSSAHTGQETTAYFENTAGVVVSLFYVDADSAEHFQTKMPPGGAFYLAAVIWGTLFFTTRLAAFDLGLT
jgi:hypothetical protein